MPATIDKSHSPIESGLPNTSIKHQVFESLKTSKAYRHAFVEEKVRTSIAAQILAIREQRGLSRARMAELMKKSRPWIFRLEDPNEAPPTISTLLSVAEAFDVDLDIRFGRFSDLLDRLENLSPESFEVPSFDAEFSDLENGSATLKAAHDYLADAASALSAAGQSELRLDNSAPIDRSALFRGSRVDQPIKIPPQGAQSALAPTNQQAQCDY